MDNFLPFAVLFGCVCVWPAVVGAFFYYLGKNGIRLRSPLVVGPKAAKIESSRVQLERH